MPFYGVTETGIQISEGKKPKTMAFSKLQPGGVKFAKRYVKVLRERKLGSKLAELEEGFVFPEEENWTSTQGKAVKAVFTSLEGDNLQLTIKRFGQSDRTHTLPLSKLDEDSQKRAKKWQELLASQEAQVKELEKSVGL